MKTIEKKEKKLLKFKAVSFDKKKFQKLFVDRVRLGTEKSLLKISEDNGRKTARLNKFHAFLAYVKIHPLTLGQRIPFEDIENISNGTKAEKTLGASPLSIKDINVRYAFGKGLKVIGDKSCMCLKLDPTAEEKKRKDIYSKKFRFGLVTQKR